MIEEMICDEGEERGEGRGERANDEGMKQKFGSPSLSLLGHW